MAFQVSFSPHGLLSFTSAGVLFSSTLAGTSETHMGPAGRQEWATDLDRFVSHLGVRTGLPLGEKKKE